MKSNKFYFKLMFIQTKHSLIRVDNIQEFSKYLNNPDAYLYFRNLVASIKAGVIDPRKEKLKPFEYEVEKEEFSILVSAIKKKIMSIDKDMMRFTSISLVEDSNHLPMVKIVTKAQKVVEEKTETEPETAAMSQNVIENIEEEKRKIEEIYDGRN